MKTGDFVCIATECVPKGLVPDKYAKLLHQRKDKKWYALKVEKRDVIALLVNVVDSKTIFLLNP